MKATSSRYSHTHPSVSHEKVTCPIPGCNLVFQSGTLGWHTHVMREDAHPYWHPDMGREGRKAAFVREFPEFLLSALSERARERYEKPKSGEYPVADLRAELTAVLARLNELEKKLSK